MDPPSPGCTGAEAVLSLQPNSSIPITYHPLFGPHCTKVTVRGQPDEDAVLCTESKTYAMKSVGTSNSLFLIPPCGQYTTFESPKCCDENYHDPQSAASVIKVATGNMELVEVAPRLDKLRLLLSQNPYQSDEDNDLIEKVQASDYKLRTGLQALSAVEINGYWRIVDEKYMGTILRMLLHNSVLNNWSLPLLNQDDVVNMLESDGFPRKLAGHCLHVFGSKVTEGATTSRVWKLDERKVCVHFAREILRDGKRKMKKFDILEGEVLIERLGAETWIRAFSFSSLPYNPEWKDLQPFIRDLNVPGLSAEGLLLKYTRRTQPTADAEPVFRAR
ncbi:sister chromatid cohesion protein DCC1-like [Pyrus ussuriensis x Pyrus communis]|uniref:Sister chromatid cohesion protein DCC1-like n=1 Tax=Pyrus ussuriensis x Pyrus communis TaxID=2448454 RepID=A0A5N5HGH2_9ROSA|nr:sister chromatid cohesion protein DCC1-like [Pyrus ussuriensis x Pyrus communis]